MKRKIAKQLLPLLKAKTQIERYAYEEIAAENQRARDQAEALRAEAMAARNDQATELMAGYYAQNEKHMDRALDHSRIQDERAENLVGPMNAKRKDVQSSFQRELALKKITAALDEEHRKDKNKAEERQHEMIRALRGAQKETR